MTIEIIKLADDAFGGPAWRAEHDYTLFTLHGPSGRSKKWAMTWDSGDDGGYEVAEDPRGALTGALSVFPDRALADQLVEAFATVAEDVPLAGSATTSAGGVTVTVAYDVTGMVEGLTEADAATVAAFPWLAEARAFQAELVRAGRLTADEIDVAVAAYARDLAETACDSRRVADLDARAAEIRAEAGLTR
jgi:hypothetical protein